MTDLIPQYAANERKKIWRRTWVLLQLIAERERDKVPVVFTEGALSEVDSRLWEQTYVAGYIAYTWRQIKA